MGRGAHGPPPGSSSSAPPELGDEETPVTGACCAGVFQLAIPLALYATYHSDACAREVTIWYYLLFGVGALGVFIGLAQLCRKRPRGGGDAERSGDALTARLWTGLQRLGELALLGFAVYLAFGFGRKPARFEDGCASPRRLPSSSVVVRPRLFHRRPASSVVVVVVARFSSLLFRRGARGR